MLLNSFIALLAVLAFAFALSALFKIKPAFTPLVSLAVLVDLSVIFALVNMLKAGVAFSYGLAFGLFTFALYKNRDSLKEKARRFFSPGVILFAVSCLAMLVFLAYKQPLMYEWDEFSFWGISQKLVKNRDALYTYYKSSMIGNSTPPTLAVLSYFFRRFNPAFTEWISYFGYDVMFFACYATFTAPFEKKSWNSAFAVYLFGFLSPYIFEVYTKIIYLEPVYISSYADIPLGVVFAGAMALALFADGEKSRDTLAILPALMFLTLIKDMGFALSCIVIFIFFFDAVVGKKEFSFVRLKGFFGKCRAAASMLAVTVAAFMSWAIHMAKVMEVNRFELGGRTNMGMAQMLITGVKELLIGPKSEKFVIIQGQMIDAFFHTKLSFLGSGVVITAIVLGLFTLSFVLSDKTGKKRTVAMALSSVVGFVGYYIFHLFLYVYIFKDNAYGLVSYNRYIYPYYIGWLCLAVFSLCLAVKNGRKAWAKAGLFVFVAVIFWMFTYFTRYDCLFIEANQLTYTTRISVKSKADAIRKYVGEDDVIYCYSGGDNSERWFMYTFEFADNYIVEDLAVDVQGLDERQAREKYRQSLYERFKQMGVTHILIDNSSEFFVKTFGDLFDVPMNDVGLDSVAYYKVNYTQDFFNFTLVDMENVYG